jgi:hypothetical protein
MSKIKLPQNRKGFLKHTTVCPVNENENVFLQHSACIVYASSKMTHSGLSCWKTFEGFNRKLSTNSLQNLIPNRLKNKLIDELSGTVLNNRHLNEKQTRQIKSYSNKLCYYSQVRTFMSKKTGSYKFKVAFITLTCPENTTNSQAIHAFEHFLDYLRRTANCQYVWKKELGEKNGKLHFHILINNFIPYYLVNWKWKRVLLQEGVKWPKNDKGKETESHYRIELPRSRKLIAHYIAKYMSKAYEIPKELGYISGHSEILEKCKEPIFIESELPKDEILLLQKKFRTIRDQFITHTCVDLRRIQAIAPTIHFWFMRQFEKFQTDITLPQKYYYV